MAFIVTSFERSFNVFIDGYANQVIEKVRFTVDQRSNSFIYLFQYLNSNIDFVEEVFILARKNVILIEYLKRKTFRKI